MHRTSVSILCLLAVMTSCARSDGSSAAWSGSIDTLPGGTIVVENPERAWWPDGRAWTLEEEVRIGSTDGTGPDVFGALAAIAVDARGRIFVLDNRARQVRVFAPDGSHIRTLGRSGAGPGEFGYPIGMTIAPDQSLLVVDFRNRRFTVFDSSGAFRAMHPRPVTWMRIPWPGSLEPTGALVDVALLAASDPRNPNEVLVRLSDAFQIRDTIPLPQHQPSQMTVRRSDGAAVMSFADPFSPRLVWRFDPRGFVWATLTERYEIAQMGLRGDTLRLVRRSVARIAVSGAERDSGLALIRERTASAGANATIDRQPRIPDSKPAVETFHVSGDGYLWVEPSRADGEPQRFDVFDSAGRYMGSVSPPDGIASDPLPVFTGDAIYGVVRDTLDVPYVVRLRIRGGR
jgi:hypothetical protein